MITPDQLHKILPNLKYYEIVAKAINDTCDKYQINTRNRVCHFLAQILHESGGLKFSEELSSGAQYENRKDLGNILQGDGKRFKGRGYIQITGRFNYEKLSKAFCVDFVSCPEKLAQNPYNILSAGWFWNERKLNKYADLNNITVITKIVNGGMNGFQDRKKWLITCFNIIK